MFLQKPQAGPDDLRPRSKSARLDQAVNHPVKVLCKDVLHCYLSCSHLAAAGPQFQQKRSGDHSPGESNVWSGRGRSLVLPLARHLNRAKRLERAASPRFRLNQRHRKRGDAAHSRRFARFGRGWWHCQDARPDSPDDPPLHFRDLGAPVLTTREDRENPVQHMVEMLSDVCGEESQDEIAVLLEEGVFAPVAAVGIYIGQVLVVVQFEDEAQLSTQEIHFHVTGVIKRDWQLDVEPKMVFGSRQCLQAAIEERFTGAPGPSFAFRLGGWIPRRVQEHAAQRHIHSIANEPANAGGVVPFPFRIKRQWHFDRPSRQRTGRQQDRVAERLISAAALRPHLGLHRRSEGSRET